MTAVLSEPHPISPRGPFWEAKLAGLLEGTTYYNSVAGGSEHIFRTPPVRGTTNFVLYVEADVGDAVTYPRMGLVQDLIAAGNPRFVLVAGDLTYGDIHGQAAVDQHFNDVMVWSQDAAYMPAWGHWAPKAAILMAEAEVDPVIDLIVTFGHRPAYSSGHNEGSTRLQNILDRLGTSNGRYVLSIAGHSHDYERTSPQNGVVHITVGTGGTGVGRDEETCRWTVCPQPS